MCVYDNTLITKKEKTIYCTKIYTIIILRKDLRKNINIPLEQLAAQLPY